MTFSEQIINALSKPGKYGEMIRLKKGRSRLYVLVICLALGVITFVVPVAAFIYSFGGFDQLFSKQLSTIRYEDDKLSLDSKFLLKYDGIAFIIDTETPSGKDDSVKEDGLYLTVGSHRAALIYMMDGKEYNRQSIELRDFLKNGFNVTTLKKAIPLIYVYIVAMYLGTCVWMFIKYSACALFLVICIKKHVEERELKISFGQLYMLCFYGESLGIIISNCNAALGLLPQFIVSLVCVFISVRMVAASVAMLDRV